MPLPKNCLSLFLALHHGTDIYQSGGQCHANCRRLAEQLRIANFSMEKTTVIYLVPIQDTVMSANTRNGPVAWKKWHVVVEHDGFILDLDYPEPKAISKELYFQSMFNSNSNSPEFTDPSKVNVKAVPAQEVIDGEFQLIQWTDKLTGESRQRLKNRVWWLNFDEKYPWISADKYFGSSP